MIAPRLRALRALVRVELRQLRRHPWRSLAMLALIAAPVAAIAGGSLLVRLLEPTGEERGLRRLGQADLRIEGMDDWADVERAAALLPAGARWVRAHAGPERVSVPGRSLHSPGYALDAGLLAAQSELDRGVNSPSPSASGPRGSPTSSLDRGLAVGLLELVEGRAPDHVGEVALSPALLDGLGRSLGDSVFLEYGGARRIVGVVVDPERLDGALLLRSPSASELPGRGFLLVRLGDEQGDPSAGSAMGDARPIAPARSARARAAALDLRMAGFRVQTREEASRPDEALTALVFVLGCLGLVEAGLVISAAFAVGLRRRQVEIGLLGATGATPAGIAAALLASTACLALVGSLLGLALGLGVVSALHPFLDGWFGRRVGPVDPRLGPFVGAVVLGVVAAVVACLVPARGAARLPIRHALAGRRPTARRSTVWAIVGALLVAAGLLLVLLAPGEQTAVDALAVLLGPVLALVGFGAASPWLLSGLARHAAPLPPSWRLALRDAGRAGERNGAVVTAVLAGMATSVTVAALVASLGAAIDAFPAPYRDDQLWISGLAAEETARALDDELSALAVAPLVAAYSHGEPVRGRFEGVIDRRSGWIALGGPELARALAIDEGVAALRSGRLLAVDPPPGARQLELSAWLDGESLARLDLGPDFETGADFATGADADPESSMDPGAPREPESSRASSSRLATSAASRLELAPVATDQWVREPPFLLATEAAADLGFDAGPPPRHSLTPWVVRLAGPVSADDLEKARAVAASAVRTQVDASRLHGNPLGNSYYLVFLISALTGLVIVLTATALSAAESAADEWVLHTVGAAPRLLRGVLAARASYLALLGCVLACPAGLLAAVAIFGAANFPLSFVVPWRDLALLVFALPALVYVLAWAYGAARAARAARSERAPRAEYLRPQGTGPGSIRARDTLATWALASAGTLLTVACLSMGADVSADPAEVSASEPSRTGLRWQPHSAEAFDGSPLEGELAYLSVPLYWHQPEGEQIELAVVRFRTRHPEPGPPIFFLAGGPGGSGVEGAATVATHPQLRLLEHADVIGLDQRGTGRSRPNLVDLEIVETLPLDRPIDREERIAALRRAAGRTAEHWRRQGVDLQAFHTAASARDLEAVRLALGAPRIVLYGGSYGSHLGFAYLRQFGAHAARAVLSKVEGPNHTWKLPSTVQAHLEAVSRMAAGDPALDGRMPDLVATLESLLARLEARPLRALDERGTEVVIGAQDLRIEVARALGSAETIAGLPALLHAVEQGDGSALVATAVEGRRAGVHALALAMDCASGASAERWRRIEAETASAGLLGDAIFAPLYPAACEAAGIADAGAAYRAPFESAVPVLLTSGTLDVRTPPENADEVAAWFDDAVHVRVANAGHESRELMSPEYRDLLQSFLRGEPVASGTITLPEPFFVPPAP